MNDDIPLGLQDFDFPEMTNNQVNIWRLRDELNATRRWLRENTVSEEEIEEVEQPEFCTHPESYAMNRNGLYRCKVCKTIFKP